MKRKPNALHFLPGFLTFAASPALPAETFEWALNDGSPAGGDWSLTSGAGWVSPGTYPNAANDIARVFKNIDTVQTITINVTNAKVGTLFLQDNQTSFNSHWNIATSNAATNFLTFEVTTGKALLNIDNQNAGGAVTISAPIKLNSDLQIRVDPTVGALISGVIADGTASRGIEKLGANVLTLSAANTYSGNTTLTDGTLRVGVANAIPSGGGKGNLSIAADGTLDLRFNAALNGLSGSGEVDIVSGAGTKTLSVGNNNQTSAYNGILKNTTGTLNLTKVGSGTLTLGGANTFTGTTSVTGGKILVNHTNALQNSSVTAVTGAYEFGTAITAASFGSLSGSGDLDLLNTNGSPAAVALTVGGNGASTTYSGSLGGSGSLIKVGAGALTLTGTNDYLGQTTVNAGLIEFGSLSNLGSGNINLNGGGLRWAAANSTDISPRLNALGASGGTFNTNGNNVSFATGISGGGSFTKSGTGNLTLSVANTFTGNTIVTGGQIILTHSSALGSSTVTAGSAGLVFDSSVASNAFNFGGLSGSANLTLENNASTAIALTVSNAVTNTYSGVLSGSGSLVKTGAGTLILSDGNTYSGKTRIIGGALQITADSGLGTAPGSVVADAITLDNGTLTTRGPTSFSIDPNRGIVLGAGGGTWNTTTSSGSHLATYNGAISGVGSLTKTSLQILHLGGENTFTGGVNINAGTLRLGSTGALNSAAPNTVAINTGILQLNGNSVTVAGLTGSTGTLRNLSTTAATLTVNKAAGNDTFSGLIENGASTGNLSLVKDGAGTLTLGGNNTFTGTTSVTGGQIILSHSNALGSSTVTAGSSGIVFDSSVVANSFSFGGIAGSNDLTLENNDASPAAVALTVGGNGNSTTYAGILSGSGALIKSGAGTLTFTNSNSYLGTTVINDGTLIINGDQSGATGALTVASTGTLGGSGIIGGSTTIQGAHAPGNSPGIQTFNDSLTYGDTSSLQWELWSNTADSAARGVDLTGYDGVDVTGGTFSLDSLATIDISLAGTVDFSDMFWDSAQNWLIVDLTGLAVASDANLFTLGAISLNGNSYDPSSEGSFSLFRADGSTAEDGVWLQWTAVPEPGVPLLSAMALCLFSLRRRRA